MCSEAPHEFRNYGANVVVVREKGQSLPLIRSSDCIIARRKTLAVPFSYAVARTQDGQSVVVVGTDSPARDKLNRWWNVSHCRTRRRPSRASAQTPIDASLACAPPPLSLPDRKPFDLTFQGHTIHETPAGLLQTGAGEDSRIYLDQSEFQNWTGVAPQPS